MKAEDIYADPLSSTLFWVSTPVLFVCGGVLVCYVGRYFFLLSLFSIRIIILIYVYSSHLLLLMTVSLHILFLLYAYVFKN